jgi:hypothetical protein
VSSTQAYNGVVGNYQPAIRGQGLAPMQRADEEQPPQVPPQEGIYPYDGGPANPVPLPKVDPLPQRGNPIDPAKGRVVSVPAKPAKFTYQAYGEKPAAPATVFAQDRTILLKEETKAARR